ncbi:hypothetical protein [Rhizobium ruizarguesonis]|uniref:hypothetical protein n=1 Tax=Rhizobium ruizarguesonis TaxID=2081791 RepID=UPI0013C0CD29|nr:hypothetical protein [Rhizobium ruizarguesonis]NEH28156.1 hypothetical protein [Rhizobium ruizarguesonis]NEK07480.1 hypothetical protein [Rhizobium ruizarguesonis]
MNSYTDESGFDGVVPAHPIECEGPAARELATDRTPQAKAQMLAGDILEQLDLSRGHMERTRIARMIEKFYPAQPDELAALQETVRAYEVGLDRIEQWAQAYPLTVFPEPDLKKARALLEAGGMTLDAISASNMRHVVEGVQQIAVDALAHRAAKHTGQVV